MLFKHPKKLSLACILDEFSCAGFSGDSNVLNLDILNWRSEILANPPDLLLVESAWFGHKKQWHRKVSDYSPELDDVIAWFKRQNIPSVFWCKEDPVHFDRFLETASHFDYVFTTDIESIPRYRATLGHSRIFLLPFACQPKFHNPIEAFPRKNLAVYAGSFYQKYLDRSNNAVMIFELSNQIIGLDIYDRYFHSDDSNYLFPEQYQKNIKGYLSHDKIDLAYKGYRYGINFNTVKNSRSMFSRRAIELLASGTIVIGNYSLGLEYLFGEITLSSDLESYLKDRLTAIVNNDLLRAKLCLCGIRKVMLEHTYALRLNTISNIVFSRSESLSLPNILVLIDTTRGSLVKIKSSISNLNQQSFSDWRAIVIGESNLVTSLEIAGDSRFIFVNKPDELMEAIDRVNGHFEWVAIMNLDDYYGPNYLLDLVLGTRYSDAQAFGKGCFYELINNKIVLVDSFLPYKTLHFFNLRSSIVSAELFFQTLASNNSNLTLFSSIEVSNGISLDYFSYCKNAYLYPEAQLNTILELVDDQIQSTGSSLDKLYEIAGDLKYRPKALGSLAFRFSKLSKYFGNRFNSHISGVVDPFGWHIISELRDGEACDLYSEFSIPIDELGGQSGTPFYLEVGVGLQMQLLVRFEDASSDLISEVIFEVNTQNRLIPPDSCTHIRLGYRITSSGSSRITRLVLAWG